MGGKNPIMKTALKILLVCNRFVPCSGGVPYHVADLAVVLAKLGHRVDVLAPHCRDIKGNHSPEIVELEKYHVNRITPPLLNVPIAYFQGTLASVTLWRFLRSGSYDIIHFHSWPTLLSDVGIQMAHLLNRHAILTIHGFGPPKGSALYQWSYELLEKRILRGALKNVGRTISVTKAGVSYLTEMANIPQRVVHVPNGIWLDGPPQVGMHDWPNRSGTFIFVGRFSISKGVDTLLTAFSSVSRSFPEARLLMVGEGSARELASIEKSSRMLDIDSRIRILTDYQRSDVRKLCTSGPILVLPSTREGAPSVILEAFASGAPVIATDVGGIRELITHGKTGLVVPPGNTIELANAMMKLMIDTKLQRDFSAEALQSVRAFDWMRIGKMVEGVYFDVLSQKGEG
jgi:glycosyltransferase involved in cell wall biosynthesis